MARFEFKYILDPVTANRAKSFVRRMMWLDPYAKERLYTVTSVYFDTPQLTDYYDKSGGFLIRKKLRARIYEHSLNSETEHIWLDIKKKYDMAFIKEHIKITRQDWEDILAHRYTILLSRERPAEEQKVLEEFIWYILQEGRQPSFFIRYKRHPYLVPSKHMLRITFDEQVETARHTNLTSPPFTTQVSRATIMEVKFEHKLPYWFGIMVRQLNLKRDSFSKYGRSIDAIYKYNPLPR